MHNKLLDSLNYYLIRLKRFRLKHGLRYKQLYKIIKKRKPKNILEIGVYDGENAIRMLKINSNIKKNYYGFDLFEDLDQLQLKKEIAIQPLNLKQIKTKLTKIKNVNINLYKVNTINLDKEFFKDFSKMDLIFIDGGHSIQTQRNDWRIIQNLITQNTIVIIDDYWNIPNSGCSFLINEIDQKVYNFYVLPIKDYYKKKWGYLITQFLKVTKK